MCVKKNHLIDLGKFLYEFILIFNIIMWVGIFNYSIIKLFHPSWLLIISTVPFTIVEGITTFNCINKKINGIYKTYVKKYIPFQKKKIEIQKKRRH